jgi:hypothetical protein
MNSKLLATCTRLRERLKEVFGEVSIHLLMSPIPQRIRVDPSHGHCAAMGPIEWLTGTQDLSVIPSSHMRPMLGRRPQTIESRWRWLAT